MKRSTPLARKTPMKRTAPMKRRGRPKMTPARKAAEGQACTLRVPGCPARTDTSVLAHLRVFNGGGMGIKPPDTEAVFGCDYCHDVIDGRRKLPREVEATWNRWESIAWALVLTHRVLRAMGVLKLEGE